MSGRRGGGVRSQIKIILYCNYESESLTRFVLFFTCTSYASGSEIVLPASIPVKRTQAQLAVRLAAAAAPSLLLLRPACRHKRQLLVMTG